MFSLVVICRVHGRGADGAGAAFLDANQQFWGSGALNAETKDVFRMTLRLEVGLFNSAYDDVVRKKTALYKIPGGVPAPHRGGEQKWRRLLGLEADDNGADEDGMKM